MPRVSGSRSSNDHMTDVHALTVEVLLAFFGVSFALGYICQRTHFCTMGAIADVVNMGDWSRARQWMLAVGVVMIGFAVLSATGQIDPGKTLYAGTRWLWLSTTVGGLMFGYGMVIASGCGNKTLVRVGSGNLKSLVVLVMMGLSAFATLKGITGVLRVNTVDTVAVNLPSGASLGGVVAALFDGSASQLNVWLGGLLGGGLLLVVLRQRDFWTTHNLLAGMGVGTTIVALWWISGHLAFVPEHPETLEPVYLASGSGRIEAASFVGPVAQSLDWLLFFSDKSKTLTVGMMSVVGVIGGSALSAWRTQTFRWEGFANTQDLAFHLLGGALMGVGGVTAMGCTFGQGLSGLSTLSLNALVAISAIVIGALLALRHQIARVERELA